jgi:Diguanylate cyclase, GGDEF domain
VHKQIAPGALRMQPVSKHPISKPSEQISIEDCLLILLRGIQNHSVIADESDGDEFRAELAALESRFKGKDNARRLVDSAVDILDKYSTQTNEVIARQRSGLTKTASDLAAAMKAASLVQGPAERLNLLEEQINALSVDGDLEAAKARLRAEVAMARAEALQERQKTSDLISNAIGGLGVSPEDLAAKAFKPVGSVYSADQLTGLPARGYAESELTRAYTQTPDCHLALFVVKRLALINAKFGYARGDQVLLKVVVYLAQSLPDFNKLFRWTPCSFLTVAPPNISYQDLRAKVQAIELMRLTPTLEWEGRSAMVPVVLDCRVISAKDFDSAGELFLRLDALASDA